MVVGRGGSCELEYEVAAEGTVISWEFISTDYDVSYGLFYKVSDTKRQKEEVVCTFNYFRHVYCFVG